MDRVQLERLVEDLTARIQMNKERAERSILELTARLRKFEDRHDILCTLNQYHHALGSHDEERLHDIFTENGVIRYCETDGRVSQEVVGRSARSEWFDQHRRNWPLGSESHAYVNSLVQIEDEKAVAVGFFWTASMNGTELSLRSTGTYEDSLVRCRDGRWRIELRKLIRRLTRLNG